MSLESPRQHPRTSQTAREAITLARGSEERDAAGPDDSRAEARRAVHHGAASSRSHPVGQPKGGVHGEKDEEQEEIEDREMEEPDRVLRLRGPPEEQGAVDE